MQHRNTPELTPQVIPPSAGPRSHVCWTPVFSGGGEEAEVSVRLRLSSCMMFEAELLLPSAGAFGRSPHGGDPGPPGPDHQRRRGAAAVAGVGLPGVSLGINLSTTGSTLHSKPPGGTKNLPISFRLEEEEGTNLPQETNKAQLCKDGVMKPPCKRKKKGRSGKRREGEKRKRRARSLGWRLESEPGSGLHLEWRSLLGLQRALL
ncbi:hypothetical protein GBF38_001218 [Nibea albiflora]|uniref:Uncharacterized protein n=1 Tax=Nibea albiflora TaxID=240163 RepID=A0ACB7EXC7_NIBAL|nr:hypothetical protein GBF38_001218 [Nibea albiflora]